MRFVNPRLTQAALLSVTLLGTSAASASAQPQDELRLDDRARAVFVQSNDLTANKLLAYQRAADGQLTQFAAIDTGGPGGRLDGAQADPLASQGSLRFDARHGLLIGVNAGNNTIYAFHVDHDGHSLSHRQVLPSGGVFPVSIAAHDDLVYVLNARGTGSVSGFRVSDNGDLEPLPGSTRDLHLTANSTPTEFLTTPGQISFTPDGAQLIVTTKNTGSHIDVFPVHADGLLSAAPTVNNSQTAVPFAITFDAQHQLVVGEAGISHVSTYVVNPDGTLTDVGTAGDSQSALCWIARDGDTYFAANAGSGSVSSFHINANGQPTLLKNNPVGTGTIDMVATARFVYVEVGGNGTIAELRVQSDGSLTAIGSVTGHLGEEGIVAL